MDEGIGTVPVTTTDVIMTNDTIQSDVRLEGVPLSLFVVMSALSSLGIIYAFTLIVFNIAKRKHKAIKMTSPNINVIILLACCGGYACVILLGLDETYVSKETMQKSLQGCVYVLVIGFSMVFGSVFTKSWRVFTIFKNLNANGKVTRDEHLLLGVFFMIILDLVILLPWHIVDPIRCTRQQLLPVMFQSETLTDVTTEIDICRSKHQHIWISVIYVYKSIVLLMGFFFSWQTRHVTLPALRDATMVNVSIVNVIIMGVLALPVLLIQHKGGYITYAVGCLIIWLSVTTSISLLLLPKVFMYRKDLKRIGKGESFRFQFSESMKRTQDAIRKLAGCLCCGMVEGDKYGQEMLLTEIETLKRTIKDKDSTIRELTDRLYVGADKFQQYLRNPHKAPDTLSDMHKKHMQRSQTYPNKRRPIPEQREGRDRGQYRSGSMDTDSQHKHISFNNMHEVNTLHGSGHVLNAHDTHRHINKGIYTIGVDPGKRLSNFTDQHTPIQIRSGKVSYEPNKVNETPSPNFDSAIDNNSPSSESSNDSLEERRWQNRTEPYQSSENIRRDTRNEGIDLEAIENEVADNPAYWTPQLPHSTGDQVKVRRGSLPRERTMPPEISDRMVHVHHTRPYLQRNMRTFSQI